MIAREIVEYEPVRGFEECDLSPRAHAEPAVPAQIGVALGADDGGVVIAPDHEFGLHHRRIAAAVMQAVNEESFVDGGQMVYLKDDHFTKAYDRITKVNSSIIGFRKESKSVFKTGDISS